MAQKAAYVHGVMGASPEPIIKMSASPNRIALKAKKAASKPELQPAAMVVLVPFAFKVQAMISLAEWVEQYTTVKGFILFIPFSIKIAC